MHFSVLFLVAVSVFSGVEWVDVKDEGVAFVYSPVWDGATLLEGSFVDSLDLPCRYFWVAVPPSGDVEFQARILHQTPFPYFPNQAPCIAELCGIHNTPWGRIAKIRVYPVSCGMQREVEIKLLFSSSSTRGDAKSLPPFLRSVVLNYPQNLYIRRFPRCKSASIPPHRVLISVLKPGIYAITYRDLLRAGIAVDFVDPNYIHIARAPLSPHSLTAPELVNPDTMWAEIPRLVKGGEDGKLGLGDTIFFFVQPWFGDSIYSDVAPHTWNNPYTDTFTLVLWWDDSEGMEWEEYLSDGDNPVCKTTAPGMLHLEQDSVIPAESGFGWVWAELDKWSGEPEAVWRYVLRLKGIVEGTVHIAVEFYSDTFTVHRVMMRWNGSVVADSTFFGTAVSNPWMLEGRGMADSIGVVEVVLTGDMDHNDRIYIDRITLSYGVSWDNLSLPFQFSIPVGEVWEVEKYFRWVIKYGRDGVYLCPYTVDEETAYYLDAGNYWIQEDVYSPCKMEYYEYGTLVDQEGCDLLIITHPSLYSSANTFAGMKEEQGVRVKVVSVDEIYKQFGWGRVDPGAIRSFIHRGVFTWTPVPRGILILGAGSYDYKNNLGLVSPKNLVPPHEEGFSVRFYPILTTNFTGDDWFVSDDNGTPWLPIARIPVIDNEEAEKVLQKLYQYSASEYSGDWEQTALVIADDEYTSTGVDGLYRDHLEYSEMVSSGVDTTVYVDKFYLFNFGGEDYSPPGEKIDAREALLDRFSRGFLYGVFFGHGNAFQLAHQHILRSPTDINTMQNTPLLPFMFFGSCNVGCFDRAEGVSLADYLVVHPEGGCVATLAPTRGAYSHVNGSLGRNLTEYMFDDNRMSIGEEVLSAKLVSAGISFIYNLFGDPVMELRTGEKLSGGVCFPDTIVGGELDSVFGTLPFEDGWVWVKVCEPQYDTFYVVRERNDTLDYTASPGVFYRGRWKVADGKFTVKWVSPLNFRQGQGLIYISGGDTNSWCAVGKVFETQGGGVVSDTTSPMIKLLYKGSEVKNGDMLPLEGELEIELSDASGIEMRFREAVSFFVKERGIIKYIGDRFVYDDNSYTTGRVSVEYSIEEGDNTLRIEAKDNAGNVGVATWSIKGVYVLSAKLWGVFNYPNPTSGSTVFTFYSNVEGDGKVTVYAISGRKVWESGLFPVSFGYNQVEWDGFDRWGRIPARGLYFYRICVDSDEGEICAKGKVVIMR